MTLVLGPEEILNLVGALLVAALGFFVASVRPRRPGNRAFAAFCISFGVSIGATNILAPGQPRLQALIWSVVLLFAVVEAGALVALALRVPTPVLARERRSLALSGGVALAYAVTWGWSLVQNAEPFAIALQVDPPVRPLVYAAFAGAGGAISVWVGALVLLALRAGRLEGVSQRAYATFCAGLVIFPPAFAGLWAGAPDPAMRLNGWPFFPFFVVLAAIWIAQAARGAWPRTCRNLALFTLALPVAGMLYTAAGWPGGFGLARTASVVIFGYAILSGQLLGIDVKVRWGISKSTIAAAFIAVFFVASEGAQQFFGDTLGSTYVGIAAAGALVFAIAPLQRVAERLAERAVPAATAPTAPPAPAAGREDAYRSALRFALADRKLSREEELELANLADHLGLPARRALELRHEEEARRPRQRRRPPRG